MSTEKRLRHSAFTAGRRWRTRLGERLEGVPEWLVAAVLVAAYAAWYAGLVVGATVGAAYLAWLLPGFAGVVAFLTVGLALVCAAPAVARVAFVRALDALDLDRGVVRRVRDWTAVGRPRTRPGRPRWRP